MNNKISIPSKIFILLYGIVIGIFLSKEFILNKRCDNIITSNAFRYASYSNKFRCILFYIIGPCLLLLIIYLLFI